METKEKFKNEYFYIKNEVLKLEKEEIFEKAFFINFYTELYNFLKYLSEEDIETYNLKRASIYDIFEFFIKDDDYSINTKNDIKKLISDFSIYNKEKK